MITNFQPKNPNEYSLIALRIIIALLWLSEGFIKIIDRTPGDSLNDYHFFKKQLIDMADTNPIDFIGSLIRSILVPNSEIIAWLVIILEFFLAISIIIGLLSKISGLVGMVYTGILFMSTLGWGEWLWTYPLIFLPMMVIFISSFTSTEEKFGFDRNILKKYQNNKILKLLL
jgi:uncharacterized membrane protein YphA (DoxX/SURF4 family)